MFRIPILFRYIFRETVAPFFASLVIVVAIIGLGQLLKIMNLVMSLNIGAADLVRVCAYIVPKILLFALPMAASLAAIIAFSRLSGDNEILVLKSCGVGFLPLLFPVVVFAGLTAGATVWTTVKLAPAATVNMKRLFIRLAKHRIAAGIRPGVFVDAIRDVVIHVDRADPDTGRLTGVYLTDLRDPAAPLAISAETGELVSDIDRMRVTLRLARGTALRLGADRGEAVSFEGYDLTVPVEPPQVIGKTSVHVVDERGFSITELAAGIRRHGPDSPRGRELASELHQRFALPVGCFILTLAGVALGMSPGPGRKPPGLGAGLLLFMLYYVLLSSGKSAAETGGMPVAAAIWGPDAALGVVTAILLYQVARDRHLPTPGEILAMLPSRFGKKP